MILDSSPLVAILAEEPDAEIYVEAISHAPRCRISAGNYLELSIVIEGQFGADVLRQCDALFRRIGIVIEPVTTEQVHIARRAFHDFGPSPGGFEFRRLLRLRARQVHGRASPVQRRGFQKNRCRRGNMKCSAKHRLAAVRRSSPAVSRARTITYESSS